MTYTTDTDTDTDTGTMATDETMTFFRSLALTGSDALKAALTTYKRLNEFSRETVVDYLLSDKATAKMARKLTLFSTHAEDLEGLDDNALVSVLNAVGTLSDKGFDVRLIKK